jgi:FixJ family two-component response regulator
VTRADPTPVVCIVDDDPSFRRAIERRLGIAGFEVHAYDSAAAFLEQSRPDAPTCALVDLHMPHADGLALQEQLATREDGMPLVFLTGRGDVRSTVRAMKGGAVDFLTKPVSGQELIDAVSRALAQDVETRRRRVLLRKVQAAYGTLTPRERQVFTLATRGLLNKQIAAELGTAERTVKAHRAQVMRKMRATSLADLVRSAEWLGIDGVSRPPSAR